MKKKKVSKILLTPPSIGMLTLAFDIRQAKSIPATEWARTYGGAYYDKGCSVVQTVDGGYAIAGDTGSFGVGGYDFWLGDVKEMYLSVEKLLETGWKPEYNSEQAIRLATRALLKYMI